MASNPLNYTGLTYEEIKLQVENLLRGDPRFRNFVDSAIYKTVIDMFAATADLTNYYIERTAEESYLDTARHLSSGILLANQMGYVVRRASPAYTALKIVIRGPIPGLVGGEQISIPAYSSMTFAGKTYILRYNYIIEIDSTQAAALASSAGVVVITEAERTDITVGQTTSDVAIEAVQGELRTVDITPQINQYGSRFQKYSLDIPEFSNVYGSADFGYDATTNTANLEKNITRVYVKSTTYLDQSLEYEIDRRSIVLNTRIVDAEDPSTERVCLIKTNKDTTIDLQFGDGIVGALGPTTTDQYIKVDYFVTDGSGGNQVGLIGNKLNYTGNTIFINGSIPVTGNIEFYFLSNCTGGADFETLESIKASAPGIYQALDRIVTKGDYSAFMKTIVDPIDMRYGVAWGESEEASARAVASVREMFNSVIVSGLGDLYQANSEGLFRPKEVAIDQTSYDDNSDCITTYAEGNSAIDYLPQSYYNFYVAGDMVNAATIQENNPNLSRLIKQFDNRSQITVKNYYITPLVQRFELQGNVYLRGFSNTNTVRTSIENTIYSNLNGTTKYAEPIYLSTLIDIIQSDNSVVKSDLKIVPIGSDIVFNGEADISASGKYSSQATSIFNVVKNAVASYIDPSYTGSLSDAYSLFANYPTDTMTNASSYDSNIVVYDQSNPFGFTLNRTNGPVGGTIADRIGFGYIDGKKTNHINERSFYYDLMKSIYGSTGSYYGTDGVAYNKSEDFINFMYKLNNWFKIGIRYGMMDENSNITNFSYQNEIAQLKCNMNYYYI